MNRTLPVLISVLACSAPTLPAQQEEEPPGQVWSCELPGGKFGVALRAISSVSLHEYLVDGAARVTEVVIATNGSLIGRFYHLDPVRPSGPGGLGQSAVTAVVDKLGQAADRTGLEPVWKNVVKSYPATTHAHTVEYRLETREHLEKLFEHADRSWRARKPATFKLE